MFIGKVLRGLHGAVCPNYDSLSISPRLNGTPHGDSADLKQGNLALNARDRMPETEWGCHKLSVP